MHFFLFLSHFFNRIVDKRCKIWQLWSTTPPKNIRRKKIEMPHQTFFSWNNSTNGNFPKKDVALGPTRLELPKVGISDMIESTFSLGSFIKRTRKRVQSWTSWLRRWLFINVCCDTLYPWWSRSKWYYICVVKNGKDLSAYALDSVHYSDACCCDITLFSHLFRVTPELEYIVKRHKSFYYPLLT